MIEQLTICLFLFEVFFVELKKDRQTDSPKPSCDTKCLSRSSNECTTTPAEAGSSLGVPARKRALSALTRSLSELHVINFIRRSHTRIVAIVSAPQSEAQQSECVSRLLAGTGRALLAQIRSCCDNVRGPGGRRRGDNLRPCAGVWCYYLTTLNIIVT